MKSWDGCNLGKLLEPAGTVLPSGPLHVSAILGGYFSSISNRISDF